MKPYNFYAGPSILHPDVIKEALSQIEAKNGLSLLELSHRGKVVQQLFKNTQSKLRELMQLDDKFEILFLHGGASLQNCMIPYNICTQESANYIDTGIWSKKSYKESEILRPTHILGSSAEQNYDHIPKNINWDGKGYLHITTNNTISGTQFHNFDFVEKGVVVADMSSDLLSQSMNFNSFGVIYAGLQKNLGTAGGTLVVIDKNLLEDLPQVPNMLNYKKHVEANSMLNTPPVFAVMMCNIVLNWIEKQGGLHVIEKQNQLKAKMLYDTIDSHKLFEGFVQLEDRSLMNVCFKLEDDSLKERFETSLENNNIVGLNGHRSKGGYRASLYNQLPLSHVEHLVKVMNNFKA